MEFLASKVQLVSEEFRKKFRENLIIGERKVDELFPMNNSADY